MEMEEKEQAKEKKETETETEAEVEAEEKEKKNEGDEWKIENIRKNDQEESEETISENDIDTGKEEKQNVGEDNKNEKEEEKEEEENEEDKNEWTLLDIKRKVQTEQDAKKEDGKQKKFRILNYTSKDSFVEKIEKEFFVYFCFLCGYNCLISEIDIKKLPKRKTDKSIIFPLNEIIHKKNNKIKPDKILIKRENGIETQYRILCKECNVPIGYVTNTQKENMFIYYYDYALLNDETECQIFKNV